MAFEIPKQDYSGDIKTTTLGVGDKAVTVGGENSYPFHTFEGDMPNTPKIAMEIWDKDQYEKAIDDAAIDFADLAEEVMGNIDVDELS